MESRSPTSPRTATGGQTPSLIWPPGAKWSTPTANSNGRKLIEDTGARSDHERLAILRDTQKFCPKCEREMVLRTASKGVGAGSSLCGDARRIRSASSRCRCSHRICQPWRSFRSPLGSGKLKPARSGSGWDKALIGRVEVAEGGIPARQLFPLEVSVSGGLQAGVVTKVHPCRLLERHGEIGIPGHGHLLDKAGSELDGFAVAAVAKEIRQGAKHRRLFGAAEVNLQHNASKQARVRNLRDVGNPQQRNRARSR